MKTIDSTRRLYAYGTVTYEDVFRTTWYTNFCFCTDFHQDGTVALWVLDRHNDSTESKDQSAGLSKPP
jgi:hypothetical protein